MFKLLKSSVFVGLGTAVVTKNKIRQALQKALDKGKITPEEAERFTKEMIVAGETEFNEIRQEINHVLYKALSEMNIADKEELKDLQSKLKNLEKRIDILEKKLTHSHSQ